MTNKTTIINIIECIISTVTIYHSNSLNSAYANIIFHHNRLSDKVNRLSQGIEEEVERLMKPMRAKLADSMLMIMKEKAGRAQVLNIYALIVCDLSA
jgi:uncharacterized protein YdcH (DUF465 family)